MRMFTEFHIKFMSIKIMFSLEEELLNFDKIKEIYYKIF